MLVVLHVFFQRVPKESSQHLTKARTRDHVLGTGMLVASATTMFNASCKQC